MGESRRQICLDTWLSRLDRNYFDWFFVVGDPNLKPEWEFRGNTMTCRAIDDWLNLVFKTHLMCKYAYQKGYDYMVKADDDTYVNTEHLKNRIERTIRPDVFDICAYMLPLKGEHAVPGNWFPAGPLFVFSRHVLKLITEEFVPKAEIEDRYLGEFLCRRDDVRGMHDGWFCRNIAAEDTTANWEPQRIGGHFKNMNLMYEVHSNLFKRY